MKKTKKKKTAWQAIAAILLFILGIAGFLWVLIPIEKEIVALELQEIRVPLSEDRHAMLEQAYQIQIETRTQAKAGQQIDYLFRLVKSEKTLTITEADSNIFDDYQINVELRPDFENTYMNPPGSMTTALLEGQTLNMSWKLEPDGTADIEGVFWVYFDFIPLKENLPESSTAILARSVNIPVQTLLSFSTRWVTIFSTAFVVAAIFFGVPQLPFFKGEQNDKPRKRS